MAEKDPKLAEWEGKLKQAYRQWTAEEYRAYFPTGFDALARAYAGLSPEEKAEMARHG